ncbi:hypothetical protein CRM94_17355 [Burkholderia gladioli]|uniref:Lipoprotein n=1 Tax=Burkholderia gladioli TaxID=28095 RepID=A0A2A7SAQ8_BURGA|nr:hypothetical protein [Burkholderia gladioli]PEH40479.1 hypothetical protein CRM94_17355 [Burkholderia gladioli]
MREITPLSRMAVIVLTTTALLSGCGLNMQQQTSWTMPDHRDAGGVLRFAYDAPSPTTGWDTDSEIAGASTADNSNDSTSRGINSIDVLRSLRRSDATGGDGRVSSPHYRQTSAPSAASALAQAHIDEQAEHAYLVASLARLSAGAVAGRQQPSNVATVTEMPDFSRRLVAQPVDVRP